MPTDAYVLGHADSEIQRLSRQARILRPITDRLLTSAGVAEGMRVLDIGCGAGDVTILLADRVGPSGRVVGIDRSTAAIDSARRTVSALRLDNVEFAQTDVETYHEIAAFDLVICRYVLIHQPDAIRFLRSARALVRAGGVIAVHEADVTRGVQSNPRVPLLHEIHALVRSTMEQAGVPIDVGGRLIRLFADAGLPAPHLFSETIVENGEDALTLRWLVDLVREMLPHISAATGVTATQIDVDTLTERLQKSAIELRSQIEFIPQICGWVRVYE